MTTQLEPAEQGPGGIIGSNAATAIERDPEPAADALTDSGEAIITPETYGQMQAEARTRNQVAQQPGPAAERAPVLTPDTADARSVETVSRPVGSAFANQRLAYAAVFERWGVSYSDLDRGQIPCDFAPSAGLQCLAMKGDWTQINQLNLPVVLELWDGEVTPYYAALIELGDGRMRLRVGNETVRTTQRGLREQWSGTYVVLWQTPPGYYGSLRAGQSHATVAWLRQQLASLGSRSLASPMPELFDDNLHQAVLEFQSAEGLTPDGIVGPATWIKLANRLRLPQPSLAG